MDPDAPSPAPAAAHPQPPRPPWRRRERHGEGGPRGDATSEKAAGESESDVRARVGGEEQEPRGDGDDSKGDDAATRGPPRRPRTPSRARPAAPDDDVAPAEEAGGGEPGGGVSRLPSDGGYRHWQRLHPPPPQLPLLPWSSKENGNRKKENEMEKKE